MRFYFESYGCTMNQGEARIMQDTLREKGHRISDDVSNSDVLVLVTCTVIETTELRMMKRLKAFTKTRKPVVVAGCMASVQKEQILAINPDANILIPQAIDDIWITADKLQKEGVKSEVIVTERDPGAKKTTDAIIPISSGCLGSCTYCITRIARSELRSCSPEMILKSINKAIEEGYKEIRLTSQDNAAYGVDRDTSLPFLLEKIEGIIGEFRVRVGMMNPETVMPMLVDVIEAYKNRRIYKFLHIPVQSGSKSVLERMGRKYSVDEFFEIVIAFRKAFQNITISTDVIIGFPGETDSDFVKSKELIQNLRPDILNITRFSSRPNTEAQDMENKIPGRIAKDRSRELTKIHASISQVINEGYIGRNECILITEHGKNGTMVGRTDAYKPVVLKDNVELNKFVDVEITGASEIYLKGRAL